MTAPDSSRVFGRNALPNSGFGSGKLFAQILLTQGAPWYIAGALGMVVSSVWNYGVNTIFTWRRDRHKNLHLAQRANL